jgi:hypothetical protein
MRSSPDDRIRGIRASNSVVGLVSISELSNLGPVRLVEQSTNRTDPVLYIFVLQSGVRDDMARCEGTSTRVAPIS